MERLLLQSERYRVFLVAYYVMRTAYLVLLICLIVHVLLRGVWIAAIGLRYVSGDIDYPNLRYQPRYNDWLARRVGSFDGYIERLERYCSVLFSVAFLIIFCFLSVTTYLMFTVAVRYVFTWGEQVDWQRKGLFGGGFMGIVCLVVGVLYFIDFLTLGFFKRNRWTAKLYYPLYRFMGWVTLANLYRPLYHNLVDHRFGRRIARLLPVFVLLALTAVSLKFVGAPYYPAYARTGTHIIEARNYDQAEPVDGDVLRRPTLSNKFPLHNYVELFVPYLPTYNDRVIQREFPDLQVSRYAGIKLRGAFSAGELYNNEADYPALLKALSSLHRLSLNGDALAVTPRFHAHPIREQAGLLYMVPTHDLPVGEHQLLLETAYLNADTLRWADYGAIYFYK